MNVGFIQQTNNQTSFGATIVKTVPMNMFLESMTKKPNSKEQIALWKSIEKAVEKHSSEKFIFTNVNYLYGQKNTVRGVLSTTTDTFVNKTVKSSENSAIWSAWKSLLNPMNKEEFNNIFGEKYESQYEEWWKNNIASIWEKLSKLN